MNLLNNKADKFILNYVKTNLSKINVTSGKCRFNLLCHYNAVHEALNHNEDKIAMCFYVDEDKSPILHFINVDNKNVFIDNTFGRWSETYEYYLIKYIDKDSFFNVNNIFKEYREELNQKLPLYIRLLSNIKF